MSDQPPDSTTILVVEDQDEVRGMSFGALCRRDTGSFKHAMAFRPSRCSAVTRESTW